MSRVRFNVITLFPQMIQELSNWGVLSQAVKKSILEIHAINPRDFTQDVHKTVDDRPFGGGDGMVMLIEPLVSALESISQKGKVIYLSPQGKTLSHKKAESLSREKVLTFVCGRYGGIDQRFLNEHIDEELSIGDYVLSGGELGAMVAVDCIARFVPGVLGHSQSVQSDSFANGFLEAPLFTRPQNHSLGAVPQVLLEGNHKLIEKWRYQVGILVSLYKRPDLCSHLSAQELSQLRQFYSQLSIADLEVLGLPLQIYF